MTQDQSITADEIALYDRQIRLWGVQAQECLRKSNVLLICMTALANEVAKNLILAGIKSLTMVDHAEVSEKDLGAQFLIFEGHIGQNRAQACLRSAKALNPRVDVSAHCIDISMQDQTFYQDFDLIIAIDLPFPILNTINAACRLASKPFYAGGTFGMHGYFFADLISHNYTTKTPLPNVATVPGKKHAASMYTVLSVQRQRDNDKVMEVVQHNRTYTPLILANSSPLHPTIRQSRRRLQNATPLLPCMRALWEFETLHHRRPLGRSNPKDATEFALLAQSKAVELGLDVALVSQDFVQGFLCNVDTEIASVTAIVGGLIAQDAIKVIQHSDMPINNMCLFDGDNFKAPIYSLRPESFNQAVFEEDANQNKAVAITRPKTPDGIIDL